MDQEEIIDAQIIEPTNKEEINCFQEKPKKKKFKIQPLFNILIILSLMMNIFLLLKVFQKDEFIPSQNTNITTNQVNYDITNTTTQVVEKVSETVVGVAVLQNGQPAGSGSGVVYKVDGKHSFIITNHHVIDGASEIQVVFSNQESVEAQLIGSDKYSDIAVLKAAAPFDVKAIDVGDSSLVKRGESALAIGSPLGIEYAGTVTQGIISSTDRVVSVDLTNDGQDDWDMNVIQTDTAINPGNSGGAFVNMAGELIGITTMKFSDTSVEGMGFVIPVNEAIAEAQEIEETGKVTRPVFGISGVSLSGFSSYELAYYNIDTKLRDGIYVTSITPNGPAAKEGLKEGDVIVEFDGEEITTYKSFITRLYQCDPGQKVPVTINRNGKDIKVTITLGR